MGILSWIVFGLVAGGLAKLLMPGKDPGGCLITMALGIGGALIGGFLATQFGYADADVMQFDMRSFGIAVAGALLLLALYRLFNRNRVVS
jgi:uncharacterized membrane protein YeaQ/YmgE (transglycosylase-associated protein family)